MHVHIIFINHVMYVYKSAYYYKSGHLGNHMIFLVSYHIFSYHIMYMCVILGGIVVL